MFDFSGLIPAYGLEFTEHVADDIHRCRRESGCRPGRTPLRLDALPHMAGSAAGVDDGATNARRAGQHARRIDGQRVDPREFVRVVLLYQQETTYDEIKTGKKRGSPRFGIIEKLSQAGLFPYIQLSRSVDRRKHRMKNPSPSLAEAPNIDADARKILEATEAASKYRDITMGAGKDAIAFAQTLAIERARRTDLPGVAARGHPDTVRRAACRASKGRLHDRRSMAKDVPGGPPASRAGRA